MLFENYAVVGGNRAVYDDAIAMNGREMQVLDQILSFFKILFGIYDALPDAKKEEMKQKAADAFNEIFRRFYQSKTEG